MTTYIGKTGRIAAVLLKQIQKLKTTPDIRERRLMFTGPPGVAKSMLAEELASAMTGESVERIKAYTAVNVEALNGQSVTVDVVRGWKERGIYRGSLFGETHVILVDEIDAISPAALNEIRTYLDRLPKSTVFICTTNFEPGTLQPQLQGRFKLYYFEKVSRQEIAAWLISKFNLPPDVAAETAKRCDGSPRAAELDALSINEIAA